MYEITVLTDMQFDNKIVSIHTWKGLSITGRLVALLADVLGSVPKINTMPRGGYNREASYH